MFSAAARLVMASGLGLGGGGVGGVGTESSVERAVDSPKTARTDNYYVPQVASANRS